MWLEARVLYIYIFFQSLGHAMPGKPQLYEVDIIPLIVLFMILRVPGVRVFLSAPGLLFHRWFFLLCWWHYACPTEMTRGRIRRQPFCAPPPRSLHLSVGISAVRAVSIASGRRGAPSFGLHGRHACRCSTAACLDVGRIAFLLSCV